MQFWQHREILIIQMTDVGSANALSLKKMRDLGSQLKKPWKLILCIGTERVFCSGGELKDYASLKTKAQGIKINREIQRHLDKLENHSAWKIALVGGDCFGGGIEFLGCFDFIVASPDVFFGFWQGRLGLSYGWGGFRRLQKKLSATFLKKALLNEKIATAFEMKTVGLVDEMAGQNQFQQLQESFEHQFADHPTREKVQKLLLKQEQSLFEQLWWTPEHRQRLQRILRQIQGRPKK